MLRKSRGIVFHTTDYSETSVIVKIFTDDSGLRSYIVNSVRKKNAKTRPSIFQPLSLVELVAYHKERGGIMRISEIRNTPPYRNIPFDVSRSSILLFLNEVLYRSIREEENDPDLFEFVSGSLQLLDLHPESGNSFHLLFMLRLARYLGFQPHGRYSDHEPVFDLKEGVFRKEHPGHPHFIEGELVRKFDLLTVACNDLSSDPGITSAERRELLERILEYFRLHIDGFGELRSHKVLEEVLGD